MAKAVPPICMAYFKGVSSDASAYPLNATEISSIITVCAAPGKSFKQSDGFLHY